MQPVRHRSGAPAAVPAGQRPDPRDAPPTAALRALVAAARRARTLILQLELMPHGTVAQPEGRSSRGDGGAKGPPGGILRRDDREQAFAQKSHEHFRRRYSECRSAGEFHALGDEVAAALDAWQRPPRPRTPETGTLAWKRMVADSDEPVERLVRLHGISRATVYKYRRLYRSDPAPRRTRSRRAEG